MQFGVLLPSAVGKDDLAHPHFTGASCGKGSWTLSQYDYTEHCSVFLPKIVICSPTGCEKVNFKRQIYDLSENEKICQRKCNIPVQAGYSQSVFAEA